MASDTTTTTIIAAAVGGGVASIIGGIFAYWNHRLTRRSDERRQIRELAVQVAFENWKLYKEASKEHGGSMEPIDVYLIHAMYLVSALDGRLKTPEQIREHLRKGFTASCAAKKEIAEINKEIQEERRKGSA